jgi:hypothetical protein
MFMALYEYLLQKYGTNEPILSSDITFKDYSRPWVMKQLKSLCDDGKLMRFEKGVYYIPTDTVFGKSVLSPRKVIEKKYINDGENIIGYYSGITFQNQLKLTTQMPNVIEIYTNKESTNVRTVMVGKQKVILRKARTDINSTNVAVLSFLEMMNDITPRLLNSEKKQRIVEYINSNRITKEDITSYSEIFPDRAMRNLIESEAIFSVA